MSCLHEFSLRMHTYIGLQACFARKQTMLAGYEDSMQACPACMNSLSECILTLVCKHASPASKLCSQDMRIACSARMCGRPAAAPYPGLRPSAAVPYPGVRPSKAGLRPYLIPASGLRPWERGLRFYLVNFYQI